MKEFLQTEISIDEGSALLKDCKAGQYDVGHLASLILMGANIYDLGLLYLLFGDAEGKEVFVHHEKRLHGTFSQLKSQWLQIVGRIFFYHPGCQCTTKVG